MDGVMIGEFHTYRDWGLILQKVDISPPTYKSYKTPVPGSSVLIDLSDMINGGEPAYEPRILYMKFEAVNPGYTNLFNLVSGIADRIHGKKLQICFDNDPGYYYVGRCSVKCEKVNHSVTSFEFEAETEPYKYEILSTLDDWEWDSFNFETGVIREYKGIHISLDAARIEIIGGEISVPLVILVEQVTEPLKILFEGKEYPLKAGRNQIPQIKIGPGTTALTFTGAGVVSIEYRGRSL